jgi:hypothetical protein
MKDALANIVKSVAATLWKQAEGKSITLRVGVKDGALKVEKAAPLQHQPIEEWDEELHYSKP